MLLLLSGDGGVVESEDLEIAVGEVLRLGQEPVGAARFVASENTRTASVLETARVVDSDPVVQLTPLKTTVALTESVEIGEALGATRLPLTVTLTETFRIADGPAFPWAIEPAVIAIPTIEMALGGSYRQEVVTDAPDLWFRLSETAISGSEAIRDTGVTALRHGTVSGSVSSVEQRVTPESGGAFLFAGGAVTRTPGTFAEYTGAFTAEFWIKRSGNPVALELLVRKKGVGGADGLKGWAVKIDTSGRIEFNIRNAADSADAFIFTSSGSVCDGEWHYIVCTWDGTTAANGAKIYVDGVVNAQATASTASVSVATTVFFVGAGDGLVFPFLGYLTEVAVYPSALSADRIAAHYAAAFWTDVSDDYVVEAGLDIAFGISGNGPTDRMADQGMCAFSLWNDIGNSGGIEGYYSPQHVNVREGFAYGILVRITFTLHNGATYQRFIGKIDSIDPEPGRYSGHRVGVVVKDLMGDLIDTDLRNITLQIDKTEAELIQLIIEALPVSAQPLSLDLDTGLDECPYAFDNLGAGMKAYTPLAQLVISSLGFASIGSTGAFRYENRQARQIVSSRYEFNDDHLIDIVVPSSLDGVYNHIRATFHPKTIDAAATTVIWSQTGVPPSIAAGATIELWGTYFNPDLTTQKIGGTEQVTPAATTDYLANTVADGSGVNKTADVDVTAEFFSSTVKFTVTNNDAGAVFLTKLQARGKGLYDLSPVTVESVSVQRYGDRAITVDMPYQASYDVTVGLSDYLLAQYENVTNQIRSFKFLANADITRMLAAMDLAIGDRVTVSEAVTGVSLADVFVQSLRLRLEPSMLLECDVTVSPTTFFADAWIMGDADRSLLGTSTVFGYA